jgi:aerobic carbon-monoxide dehydrogenase medium subunit
VTPFELLEPRSLKDAVSLLDPEDPDVRPISGGTALMLMMKAGVFKPRRLVSLRSVEARYSRIEMAADGSLRAGALTPLSRLERSSEIRRGLPVLSQTLRTLSNVRVRNVATVGGNLAHGDPHMDLPPLMMALGASVTVLGPGGERTVAVEDLLTGYYETSLARNEVIAELIVPPQKGRHAAYLKCTLRTADDWPALGVAASLEMQGGTVKDARIVVSAATEKATRLPGAEAALRGSRADDAAFKRAGDAAAAEAATIADGRGSAAYKRELVRVFTARALKAALAAEGRA